MIKHGCVTLISAHLSSFRDRCRPAGWIRERFESRRSSDVQDVTELTLSNIAHVLDCSERRAARTCKDIASIWRTEGNLAAIQSIRYSGSWQWAGSDEDWKFYSRTTRNDASTTIDGLVIRSLRQAAMIVLASIRCLFVVLRSRVMVVCLLVLLVGLWFWVPVRNQCCQ